MAVDASAKPPTARIQDGRGRGSDPSDAIARAVAGLLILWVALIGADRINLAAGTIGFIVTPFLALTPIILLLEAIRLGRTRGELRIPRNSVRYCLTATAFLFVIGFSAIISLDPVMSGRRTVLLAAQVYGTFLTGIVLLNQRRPIEILVRGTYLGLVVATLMSLVQVYFWATDGWDPSIVETEVLLNLAPRTYGALIPRLSGATIDQGRAGLLYLIQFYILLRFAPASKSRTFMMFLASVSLVGTLARSAMLGAVVAGCVYWVERGFRVTRGKIFVVSSVVAAATAAVLFLPSLLEVVGRALGPLGGRFTGEEESTSMHFALIEHGLQVATSSIRNALAGIGYGNGWLVLAEFFPGDRYANFHSIYVTLLTEGGVFALALGLVLMVYPFVATTGPMLPLLAGLLAYNIFYQSTAEPAFWFVICLAWLTVGTAGRIGPSPTGTGSPNGKTTPLALPNYPSLRTTPVSGT